MIETRILPFGIDVGHMTCYDYRFLLMVRKGYRNPPYHNWIHAFTVAHFCYLLYKNAKISNRLRLVSFTYTLVSGVLVLIGSYFHFRNAFKLNPTFCGTDNISN